MTNKEDIQIPDEYKEKSRHIEQLWELFLETGENLDRIVLEMRTILIDAGMGATDAMKKIAHDHRHLKGFSLKSLYRMLPAEEKQQQAPKIREKRLSNDNELDLQKIETNVLNIPQTPPNIVDIETEPIIQQPQQERRTPEAPDNSMVEQLNHINIKLKKELEDLHELMDIRMADKDKRIQALVNDVLNYEKAIQLLTEENTQLKAELARHKRLEELRLEAQRRAIKEWNLPGHKP